MRNGIAYATFSVILFYTIVHVTKNDDVRIYYSHSIYIVTAISILLLHAKHQYRLVEYMIMLVYPIGFMVSAIFIGKEYHVEYLLILTSIGSIYLFKKKKTRFLSLTFNIIIFVFIKYHFIHYPNGLVTLAPSFTPFFNLLNGIIALLLVFAIVYSSYTYSEKLYRILKQVSKNQENIIAERTKEINQKTEELERSNLELKRFAYISAHDLREPLRNILSFSQLLDRSLKNKNYDKIDEYFSFINSSILRMDTITKDIVNFSELDQHISDFKYVDTNTIVQQIFDDCKENQANIKLLSDDLPPIVINPKLCKELFQNLIENGLSYSKKAVPQVNIQYIELPDHYRFSIKDNGIGIPKEYHETIFMMFKRLQNNMEQQGSGIGLAICQKIITGYGGEIWVESQVNQGSTFYFTFPKK